MTPDWQLITQIGVPVASLFLGAWVQRWFEKRPQLISYYGHVAAFKFTGTNGQRSDVFTHSVVVKNAGKKSATNVRIRHTTLPNFQIFPVTAYSVNDLPDGKEILLPSMAPGEEVTLSYLYFPPLTYDQIHAGIKSDEALAKQVPVLIQRQFPRWFLWIVTILFYVGAITVLYLLVHFLRRLVA
jgi:hypothetical protein